jgi:hypothetical protein
LCGLQVQKQAPERYLNTRVIFKIFLCFMKIAFTRLWKIRNLLRAVNFRRQPHAEVYPVDTTDERGTRSMFLLSKREADGWQISSPSLPVWMVEAIYILTAAIQDEEASGSRDKKRTA